MGTREAGRWPSVPVILSTIIFAIYTGACVVLQ